MKPELGIVSEKMVDGYNVISIDTRKAKHQDIRWRDLGDFGKRKFYNWLVMTRAPQRIKIMYV